MDVQEFEKEMMKKFGDMLECSDDNIDYEGGDSDSPLCDGDDSAWFRSTYIIGSTPDSPLCDGDVCIPDPPLCDDDSPGNDSNDSETPPPVFSDDDDDDIIFSPSGPSGNGPGIDPKPRRIQRKPSPKHYRETTGTGTGTGVVSDPKNHICEEGMTELGGYMICKHCGTNLRKIR